MHNLLPDDLDKTVATAIAEDVGSGDITAQLIPAEKTLDAKIIAKEAGVLCGVAWANAVFHQLNESITLNWLIAEGEDFVPQQTLVEISGPAREILTGERSALNFLQLLSATATHARSLSSLISHTKAAVLDTRKTLPGLRTAQKYAVAIGGAQNHRIGLFDAYLIKENHIAACGGIPEAIEKARELSPSKPVEIEVQNEEELELALGSGADIVMLDNFDLEATANAVNLTAGRAKLEASGGIEGDKLVAIAETGVDYISIGALTKNCRAIDLSLLTC